MNSITIKFKTLCKGQVDVFLNDHLQTSVSNNSFTTGALAPHKTHFVEFRNTTNQLITVEKLFLDGIDTEYFIYHGFLPNSERGNANNQSVKYYFNIPIWDWFLNWKENDNSTNRMLSKTHQGFIPL
jgi:hypothetical protein